MGYWDKVVEEVVHGTKRKSKISLTNVCIYKVAPKCDDNQKKTAVVKKTKNKYYLGKRFPGVYFTEKELLTTTHIFYGKSIVEIARILALSKRTIEFYVKNIKKKLDCRYITDLIRKILNTDLSDYIKKAKNKL